MVATMAGPNGGLVWLQIDVANSGESRSRR